MHEVKRKEQSDNFTDALKNLSSRLDELNHFCVVAKQSVEKSIVEDFDSVDSVANEVKGFPMIIKVILDAIELMSIDLFCLIADVENNEKEKNDIARSRELPNGFSSWEEYEQHIAELRK